MSALLLFIFLVAVTIFLRRHFARSEKDDPTRTGSADREFIAFQRRYLLVYVLAVFSDWLQGPYVVALYKHYGYDIHDISVLFIIGFGSSMIFGTFAGSVADKFGRKRAAIAFGIIYAISCLTKFTPNYAILLIGRLTGGIATSLLFSVFEAWMVYEHNARGFSPDWIGSTFDKSVLANSVTAIVAGLVASQANDLGGPVAPFFISLIVLIVLTGVIAMTWTENYGDSSLDLPELFRTGFRAVSTDRRVFTLGVAQSLFEGAMYTFVFLWSPMLMNHDVGDLGTYFACFMVCIMIGSSFFSAAVGTHGPEAVGCANFGVAAGSLIVASLSVILSESIVVPVMIAGFLVFEMCCGVYFPCQGVLRSRYIAEDCRAGVMNLFRVPLNLIVIVVLIQVSDGNAPTLLMICAGMLVAGAYAQSTLMASRLNSTEPDIELGDIDKLGEPIEA